MCQGSVDKSAKPLRALVRRFLIVTAFGIAFGYIEAAVVVYLRAIFYPEGFIFPLAEFGVGELWRRLLLTEVGRESASMVLIVTGCWLFGRNLRERVGWFLVVFAVWDIFYYLWLKVLVGWPGSIMDWDILFLIPLVWASPVVAPVLVSVTMLAFAVMILYRDWCGMAIKATSADWLGFGLAGVVVVVSFLIAGLHIQAPDFRAHFHWPVFVVGEVLAVGVFLKCLLQSR